MFTAVAADSKLLRDSIDTISQLIDDGLFKLKKDSIELIATDRAMVAVVDFKLQPSAFEEYRCDQEKSIGINLLNFLTILKRAGPDDKLKLNLNENENRLEITLEGKSIRNFAIPLLELTAEEIPPINQLEFPASADVKADIIEQGINDADIIADSVVIELDSDKLRMHTQGDSSKAELRIEKGEVLDNIMARDVVKSRYPLDYLKKIIKAARIANTVKIQLGTDYPLRLEFKGDHVSLTTVLAPRVSEE